MKLYNLDLSRTPLRRISLAGGCMLLALMFSGTSVADVLGTKPAHIADVPGPVENEQAITRKIWAPEIDDGYVPQGIAFAEGNVLVSSYRSTDPKVGTGPCRVYRLDTGTGRVTGRFDMSEECGHAGGMAYAGKGVLIVADTRRLYKIDMAKAFADGNARNALLGTIGLAGELKGSFVDFDGKSVFIGSSEKDASKAKAFFLPFELFESRNGATIDQQAATRSFPIAANAQGAAFDSQGGLWLTFSNSKHGMLQKVDPTTGEVLAQHQMVIGIEDIGFDDQGRLWSVSEAGSLRWSRWARAFPVVFEVDTLKLR